MSELAKQKCVPCEEGTSPLSDTEMKPFLDQLDQWEVVEGHHLIKTFKFGDFAQALDMVNRIGMVAESQNHHPDLYLAWGKVEVKIWTHSINGLTESDFIFAAKVDVINRGMRAQLGLH